MIKIGDLVCYSDDYSSPDEESVFLVIDRRKGLVIGTEIVCILLHPVSLTEFPVYEFELKQLQHRNH